MVEVFFGLEFCVWLDLYTNNRFMYVYLYSKDLVCAGLICCAVVEPVLLGFARRTLVVVNDRHISHFHPAALRAVPLALELNLELSNNLENTLSIFIN